MTDHLISCGTCSGCQRISPAQAGLPWRCAACSSWNPAPTGKWGGASLGRFVVDEFGYDDEPESVRALVLAWATAAFVAGFVLALLLTGGCR